MTSHTDIVVDQFTQQATPFANSTAMRDEEALRLLVDFSGAGADDTVLDVACGPGLVVAAFAKTCRRAAGIDITPAMIGKAREHAAALSLTNVDWHTGNVLPLPFPDRSFAVVVSRFAFHHFVHPLAVLREMARVATRRIVVVDMVASDDSARATASSAPTSPRSSTTSAARPRRGGVAGSPPHRSSSSGSRPTRPRCSRVCRRTTRGAGSDRSPRPSRRCARRWYLPSCGPRSTAPSPAYPRSPCRSTY